MLFRSHIRRSAVLAYMLLVFAVSNTALFLLAETTQQVQAKHTPAVSKTVEMTTEAAPAQTAPAQPTPQPAPAPTPASTPTPTPKPAPAYDKVSIPSLGFSSQYVPVGLTSTNAVDVHPTLVGWFDRSAQPGTPGAVFLDGHNPGIFRKLPSIQVGAQITLTKASGETFNYTVAHIETVQLATINMGIALSPYGGALEGLNLMTCVGTYNPATGTTDQRLIVYALRS